MIYNKKFYPTTSIDFQFQRPPLWLYRRQRPVLTRRKSPNQVVATTNYANTYPIHAPSPRAFVLEVLENKEVSISA
jgi:hypothetical protein